MDEREQFWMVWRQGGGVPTFQHASEAGAINEAERLARKNPGAEFVVLQATHVRVCDSMQRITLSTPCPF